MDDGLGKEGIAYTLTADFSVKSAVVLQIFKENPQ